MTAGYVQTRSISMTELRTNTSVILSEVEAGAVFVITRYGKPVAYLVPPTWVGGLK